MNEVRYLVDNNALVAIAGHRIRTQFFRATCYVTSDVLREAGDHPDRIILEERSIEMEPAILEWTREVMREEPLGDTSLVDLYGNKGAADPGLIATALFQMAIQDGQFFADSWVLVTNDNAVAQRATDRGVEVISSRSLIELIDNSTSAAVRY